MLAALAIGGACYLGTLLGLALLFPTSYFSVIWPPNAILLSTLLIYPRHRWPSLLLVGAAAQMVAQLQFGTPLVSLTLSYVFDCALILVTALALLRFGPHTFNFGDLRGTAIFVAVLSGAAGVMCWLWPVIVLLFREGAVDVWMEWRQTFLSNLLPFLVLIPGIVLASIRGAAIIKRLSLRHVAEIIVLAAGLVACGIGIFGLRSGALVNFPALFYVPVAFLLWAAVRFGTIGLSGSFLLS